MDRRTGKSVPIPIRIPKNCPSYIITVCAPYFFYPIFRFVVRHTIVNLSCNRHPKPKGNSGTFESVFRTAMLALRHQAPGRLFRNNGISLQLAMGASSNLPKNQGMECLGTLNNWRMQQTNSYQQLQLRHYLYLPVSWAEFKERWQRWVERTEQRFVEVKLITRRRQMTSRQQSRRFNRFVSRSQDRWNSWYNKQRQGDLGVHVHVTSPSAHTFNSPSPYTNLTQSATRNFQARYNGWKSRQKDQYQGWKTRREEQFQGWKVRRQQQLQRWEQRGQEVWVRTKQVLLKEYSKPDWFDENGRPLTSRDSTGRFVNPWQSQSTNGVHSFETLLRWQIQRVQREMDQFGIIGSLIPKLSWGTPTYAEDEATGSKSPLPQLNKDILSMTWVGHSTCWLQINGFTILTDPIFSLRASPFQSLPVGVSREVSPSHSITELVDHAGGKIDVCCITHDHYDHLDRGSVLALAPFVRKWVVPLGIAIWLVEKCGIPRSSISELEWWEQTAFGKEENGDIVTIPEEERNAVATGDMDKLVITCCPASHWASRTMFDRNKRLWCSFAICSPFQRIFFCGDSSYPDSFPLFRQIGDALGPFDLACIPIGAYEPAMLNRAAHVNPAEAVLIHKDIASRQSVAIHWGSFPLSEEMLDEPPKKLKAALDSEANSVAPFDVLEVGRSMELKQSTRTPPFFTTYEEIEDAKFESEEIDNTKDCDILPC